MYLALASSWKEVFSHLFPTLRGLERPVAQPCGCACTGPDLPAEPCDTDLAVDISEIRSQPGCPALLRVPLPARWCRTVTLSALPRKALPLLAFSKDRPSVAPESPSPLPNRIAPVLRQSAATPPARSDLVDSHHFAGLLLVDPVRTVAAAHAPGVHRRFTSTPGPKSARAPVEGLEDSRDACSALRSFPSADGRRRRTASCPCGEALTSGPVVTLLCCNPADSCTLPRAHHQPCLEARSRRRPAALTAGPLPDRPKRSHAPKVHQPPCRLVLRSARSLHSALTANLAAFLHRRVRCAVAVSSFRTRCSRGLGLLVPLTEPRPRRAAVQSALEESVRQREVLANPPFGFRPFGFRRCRGGPKQAACQPARTDERRFCTYGMGNLDPTARASCCLWRTRAR